MTPKKLLKSIRERLSQFSINEVANDSGVNRQTIYLISTDDDCNPTVATLELINESLTNLENIRSNKVKI